MSQKTIAADRKNKIRIGNMTFDVVLTETLDKDLRFDELRKERCDFSFVKLLENLLPALLPSVAPRHVFDACG